MSYTASVPTTSAPIRHFCTFRPLARQVTSTPRQKTFRPIAEDTSVPFKRNVGP